nr:protein argonaute [Quercus suber]
MRSIPAAALPKDKQDFDESCSERANRPNVCEFAVRRATSDWIAVERKHVFRREHNKQIRLIVGDVPMSMIAMSALEPSSFGKWGAVSCGHRWAFANTRCNQQPFQGYMITRSTTKLQSNVLSPPQYVFIPISCYNPHLVAFICTREEDPVTCLPLDQLEGKASLATHVHDLDTTPTDIPLQLTMAGHAKQYANRLRDEHRGPAPSSSTAPHANRASSSRAQATSPPSSRSHTGGSRLRAIAQYDGGSVRSSGSGEGSGCGSGEGSPPGSPSPKHVRNPVMAPPVVEIKNVDLPVSAWKMINTVELSANAMPPRPKPSTMGIPIKVALNTFAVTRLPQLTVYQFDVMVGSGAEKRGLIMKCWESKAVQQALGKAKFIFDGNKLAWSDVPITREHRIQVDLDAEQGRSVRPGGKENKHRVVIRQTNKVDFASLTSFMSGTGGFDNAVLEAINFFDHLLRELPSKRFTSIKRSLFMRGSGPRISLGGAVEALKGAYQSVRIVHIPGGAQLSINVDVNNSAFFKQLRLLDALAEVSPRGLTDMVSRLSDPGCEKGPAAQDLNRFRRLRVYAQHRGKVDDYVIDRFIFQSAKDYKFEKDGVKISLYDYFAKTYKFKLTYPNIPLVKMTKKGTVLPIETLTIKENQRYPFKLSEAQTSSMIKVAATPPADRLQSIEASLKMLDWKNDKALNHYGVKIDDKKTIVNGRLLPAPKVQFGVGDARPGTSGRWDLKGKKFLTANAVALKSWGVCAVHGRRGSKPDRTVIENFIKEFVKIYIGHGGRVENKQPAFCMANTGDVAQWVTSTWNAAGNAAQSRPQMLIFVLTDKDANTYGRIKRSAECRYGVVSQCMQYTHMMKGSPQYISNVCMKFNAKLGGSTARAIGPKTGGPTGAFSVPTVIVGADVSHAAPGAKTPSMAAMTVSLDKLAIRYSGLCETNGFRVEMITTENITQLLKPQMKNWMSNVGGGRVPQRLFYFRDGVSEGQFTHVLQQEVHDMKALLKSADPNSKTQFVVVVAGKRHHIRMFPEPGKGDKNGNPLPGTLVETGVTHPFENDFYLCGHAAIKGTARPTHYSVLLNEAGISNDELQMMIYEHGRAVPHDPKWIGSTDGTPGQAQAQAQILLHLEPRRPPLQIKITSSHSFGASHSGPLKAGLVAGISIHSSCLPGLIFPLPCSNLTGALTASHGGKSPDISSPISVRRLFDRSHGGARESGDEFSDCYFSARTASDRLAPDSLDVPRLAG